MTSETSSTDGSTLTARDVLASPAVLAFLLSQFVVTTGVMLQAAALGKHVYDITGDEINIGWLGLAEFLPAAVLVLVTGTVADRFNRKYVGMLALAGEAVSALALLLYARTEPTSAAPMFVIAVVFGASRAFAAPSIRSIVPMIAPEGGLSRVVALYSATWTSAAIIGPAVSGFLYSVDPSVAYGGAMSLMIVGIAALSRVQ